MTVYNGKAGGVAYAGAAEIDEDVNSWQINTSSDVADSTGMGDTWEERIAGLFDISASVEINSDSASDYATDVAGSGGALALSLAASGPLLSGDVICTSVTETASIDDIGKVSFTFEGNDVDGLTLSPTGGSTGTTTGTKWHGKLASASFGSAITQMTGWSYTINSGTADSTSVSDTNSGRTRTTGFLSGTASVTAYRDTAEVPVVGATATLALARTAAINAMSASAICTGIDRGLDKSGNATVTFNFEFTGAVIQT